ncbi:MAG: serine/threonine protein kinase, partial [Deltaproteobacteria bacterium]|nr:serine/threonine protein kinase [Deltaproteobacteria bacterium]
MPDDSNDGKTAFLSARPPPPPPRKDAPKVPDTMPEVPLEQAVGSKGPARMAVPVEVARQAAAALSGEQPTLSRGQLEAHGSDEDDGFDPDAPKFMKGTGQHEPVRPPPQDFPPIPTRKENLTPEHPGRYVLRKEFGRGGQSSVWLALDQHVGREVAFKQLLGQNTRAGNGVSNQMVTAMAARFVREARITGQLEHPSIVPVYEVGRRADGSLYYTQKLVRGRTLTAALKECKTLRDRLSLMSHFVAMCQAIAYAHKRGVIHRDLKPDNVMVGEWGETVVLDWGLAKARGQTEVDESEKMDATQEGDVLGTPAYMSPEQAMGSTRDVDEQSDVWSLGAILFEFLTGRPPFQGRNLMQMLMQVAKDPVPKVSSLAKKVPPELAAIAEAALTREKSKRTRDVKSLLDDVEAWRLGQKVSVYKERVWQAGYRWLRKNRTFALSALVILLLTAGFAVRIWLENKEARRNLAQAYLEKSATAGRELKWARASAYAAAARVEDDTAEARWRTAHRGPYELS